MLDSTLPISCLRKQQDQRLIQSHARGTRFDQQHSVMNKPIKIPQGSLPAAERREKHGVVGRSLGGLAIEMTSLSVTCSSSMGT